MSRNASTASTVEHNSDSVLYEQQNNVAYLTLNTPQNRNALSEPILSELINHLQTAQKSPSLRALVLQAKGQVFCAGANLKSDDGDFSKSVGTSSSSGVAQNNSNKSLLVVLLQTLQQSTLPILAKVEGSAFGGGIGLLAACDIVVASASASFAFSEIRLGLVPAIITNVVLPKLGYSKTLELCLTGQKFTAQEACTWGLVHRVAEASQVQTAVDFYLDAFKLAAPQALKQIKPFLKNISPICGTEEGYQSAEIFVRNLLAQPEAKEGMSAFKEKRPPNWVKNN